jgi:predicted TIM-barrel fold metal-dependent hydrolase
MTEHEKDQQNSDLLGRRSFMLGASVAAAGLSVSAGETANAQSAGPPITPKPPGLPWKIAFEEHYLTLSFNDDVPESVKPSEVPVVHRKLLDVGEGRLALMDRARIQYAILSLNSPGIQAEANREQAIRQAKLANDELKAITSKYPQRLGGFAALPMQEPKAAADELERCVRQLGFHGALVNSFSNIEGDQTVSYLDEPQFLPFWERVHDLDVPLYLHPRNPPRSQQLMFRDHPELLAATWAFLVETSTHALRLITSGLFDRYPRLQICLGHLGEALPFYAWRLSTVYKQKAPNSTLKRTVTDYLTSNFHYTTSGFFNTPALVGALQQVGSDRVLFSADHPWMDMTDAGDWFDGAELNEPDRLKIGRSNAVKLFKLTL